MTLAADLSALPTGLVEGGRPPDANPRFVTALAQAWYDVTWDKTERAFAVEGTRFRASWAGSCARDLAYKIAGLPSSNPPTLADAWRMGVGKLVHAALDDALTAAFPGADVEVAVDLTDIGLDGSCTVDAVIRTELEDGTPWVTSLELKTAGGTKFKVGAYGMDGYGNVKKPAEGPMISHLKQGAMGALGADADELVIGWLALENIGEGVAAKVGLSDVARFAAEWTYTRAEYTEIADREIRRMAWVGTTVDEAGGDPLAVPRVIELADQTAATVTDPEKGTWVKIRNGAVVDNGKTWLCGYCDNRDRCIGDGD